MLRCRLSRRAIGFAVSLSALALLALPAAAASIYSEAGAASYDYDSNGNLIAQDTDGDQSSSSGERVEVGTIACPAPCVLQPNPNIWYDPNTAAATAETSFGSNRARVIALSNDAGHQDIAVATSIWWDDWTIQLGPQAGPVTIDFALDGSWDNFASVSFAAAVVDPLTTSPIPDVGIPNAIALFRWDNSQLAEDGSVDFGFSLQFVPVAGRTYQVGALLEIETGAPGDFVAVSFFSTARVTQVTLPAGAALISGAGALAAYNVVPEPSLALLSVAALAALALARRRA